MLFTAGESISDQPGVVKMYLMSNTNTTVGQLDGDRKYSRFGASMNVCIIIFNDM